jgi:ATP-dependent DNA helicase RecG
MMDFALASLAEDGEVLSIGRDKDLSQSPRLNAELDYRF